MLEGIALNAINGVASQFIDLTQEDFSIRVTGDVQVRQVRIKQNALQYFCPALKIKQGTVNDTHVRVHYFRLKTVPTTVHVGSVDIELESLSNVKLTPEAVKQIMQEQFYQKLGAALSQQEAYQEFLDNSETLETDYNELLLRMAHNARVEVDLIRITYSDAQFGVQLEIRDLLLQRSEVDPMGAQIVKLLTVGRVSLQVAGKPVAEMAGLSTTIRVRIIQSLVVPEVDAQISGEVSLKVDTEIIGGCAELIAKAQGIEQQFNQIKTQIFEEQKSKQAALDKRRLDAIQKLLEYTASGETPSKLHILQERHELRQYMKLFCQHYLASVTKDGQQTIKIVTKNTRANGIVYQFPFCKDYPVMCGDVLNNAMLHRLHEILDLDDIVLARRVVMQYVSQWDKNKLISEGFTFDAPDHAIRYMIDQHNSKAIRAEQQHQIDRGQVKFSCRVNVQKLQLALSVDGKELLGMDIASMLAETTVRGNNTVSMSLGLKSVGMSLGGAQLVKAEAEHAVALKYDQISHAFGVATVQLENFNVQLNADVLAPTIDTVNGVFRKLAVHAPVLKAIAIKQRKNKFERLRMYREGEAMRRLEEESRKTMKMDVALALKDICLSVTLGSKCQHKVILNSTNQLKLENTPEGVVCSAFLNSFQLGSDLGPLVDLSETKLTLDSDEKRARIQLDSVQLTLDLTVLSGLVNDFRAWKDGHNLEIAATIKAIRGAKKPAPHGTALRAVELDAKAMGVCFCCGQSALVFSVKDLNASMKDMALKAVRIGEMQLEINKQNVVSTSGQFLALSEKTAQLGKLSVCYRPNPVQAFLQEMCKGAMPLLKELQLLLPSENEIPAVQKPLPERKADALQLFQAERVVKPWKCPAISFQGLEISMMHHDRDIVFAIMTMANLNIDEKGSGVVESFCIKGAQYDVFSMENTRFELLVTSKGPEVKCTLGPSRVFVSLEMARRVIHYAYTDMFNAVRYIKQLPAVFKTVKAAAAPRLLSAQVDIPNIVIEAAVFNRHDGLVRLSAQYLGLQIGSLVKDSQVMRSLTIGLNNVSMDTCIGDLESRSIDSLSLDITIQMPVAPDKIMDLYADFSLEKPLTIQFDRAILEQIIIRHIRQLVTPCSSVRLEKVRAAYLEFVTEQALLLSKSSKMADLVEAFSDTDPNFLIMNLLEFFKFVNRSFRSRCKLLLVGIISSLKIDLLQSLELSLGKLVIDLSMGYDMVLKATIRELGARILGENFAEVSGLEVQLSNNPKRNAASVSAQHSVCYVNTGNFVDAVNIFNPVLKLLVFPANKTQAKLNKTAHIVSEQMSSISRYSDDIVYGSDVFDETLTALLKSKHKKCKETVDCVSEISLKVQRGQFRILQGSSNLDILFGVDATIEKRLKHEYSTLHEEAQLEDYTLSSTTVTKLGLRDFELRTDQSNQKLNTEASIPNFELTLTKKLAEYLDANSIKARIKISADFTLDKPIRIQIASQSIELLKGILEEVGRLELKQSTLKNMPYMGRKFKMFHQLIVPYDAQLDSVQLNPHINTSIEAVLVDNIRTTHYPLLRLASVINSQHSTVKLDFFNQNAQAWQNLLDSDQITRKEGESIHQEVSKLNLLIDESAFDCLNRCAASLGRAKGEISEIKHLADKYQLLQTVDYEDTETLPALGRLRAMATQDVSISSKKVFRVINSSSSDAAIVLASGKKHTIAAAQSRVFDERISAVNDCNIDELYACNSAVQLDGGSYVEVTAQGLQTSVQIRRQVQVTNKSKLELIVRYADGSNQRVEDNEKVIPATQQFTVLEEAAFTSAYEFKTEYDVNALDIPEFIQVSSDKFVRVQVEVVAQKLLEITLFPTFEITNDLLDEIRLDAVIIRPGCTYTFYSNPEDDIKATDISYQDYSLKKAFSIYKHKSIGFKTAQSWSICKRIPLEGGKGSIGNKVMVHRPIEVNSAIRGHYAHHAVLYASAVVRNFTDFDISYLVTDEKQKAKQTYVVAAKHMSHVTQLEEGMTLKATLLTPDGEMTTDAIDTSSNAESSVQKYQYNVSYCVKLAPNRLTRYVNFFPGRVIRNRTVHDLELKFEVTGAKESTVQAVAVPQKQETITYANGNVVEIGGKQVPLQNRCTYQFVYGDALLSLCCVQKNSIQFVDIFESQIQQFVLQNDYGQPVIVRQKLQAQAQEGPTEYRCKGNEQINLVLDDVAIDPVFEVLFEGEQEVLTLNPLELGTTKSTSTGKSIQAKLVGFSTIIVASDTLVSVPPTPALQKTLQFNLPEFNLVLAAGDQRLALRSQRMSLEVAQSEDTRIQFRCEENALSFESDGAAYTVLQQRGLSLDLQLHKQLIRSAALSLGTADINIQQTLIDFALQRIMPRLPSPKQLYGFIASSTMSAGPVCIPVYPVIYVERIQVNSFECGLTVDISSLPLEDPRVKTLMQFARLQGARLALSSFTAEKVYGKGVLQQLTEHLIQQGKKNAGSLLKSALTVGEAKPQKQSAFGFVKKSAPPTPAKKADPVPRDTESEPQTVPSCSEMTPSVPQTPRTEVDAAAKKAKWGAMKGKVK